MRTVRVSRFVLMAVLSLAVALGLTAASASAQMKDSQMMDSHTSKPFTGVKGFPDDEDHCLLKLLKPFRLLWF